MRKWWRTVIASGKCPTIYVGKESMEDEKTVAHLQRFAVIMRGNILGNILRNKL